MLIKNGVLVPVAGVWDRELHPTHTASNILSAYQISNVALPSFSSDQLARTTWLKLDKIQWLLFTQLIANTATTWKSKLKTSKTSFWRSQRLSRTRKQRLMINYMGQTSAKFFDSPPESSIGSGYSHIDTHPQGTGRATVPQLYKISQRFLQHDAGWPDYSDGRGLKCRNN